MTAIDTAKMEAVGAATATAAARRRWRGRWQRGARWAMLLLAALVILGVGQRWRASWWQNSQHIRFRGDIQNAMNQGREVVDAAKALAREGGRPVDPPSLGDMRRAWVERYDELVERRGDEGDFGLDYTPARLGLMSLWMRSVLHEYPDARSYDDRYTPPLLAFNTACELASMAGVFVLALYWLRRSQTAPAPWRWRWPWAWVRRSRDDPPPAPRWAREVPHPWRAAWGAMFAAALLWLNPVVVLNAHAWPQWDVWVLPFYIWAVALASPGFWLPAGILIGLGAMFKGQILFAAPVLVIWPIMQGRWGALPRLAAGFVLGGAIVVWPWLVRSAEAYWFLAGVMAAVALVAPWYWNRARRWPKWVFIAVAAVATGLAVWPWMGAGQRGSMGWGLALATVIVAGPWVLRHRGLVGWVGVIAASAIVLAAMRFDSSDSWYRVGFEFPQRHYRTMAMGTTSNLPAILGRQYGWDWADVAFQMPAHALWIWPDEPTDILIRNLLKTGFFILMTLCGIGAAMHARRNDSRFLVAVVAPWVLAFALLPQMHERYLLWASALAALAAVTGLGMTLMWGLMSALAFLMTFHTMLNTNPRTAPEVRQWFDGTLPGIGWMVVLASLVYLYGAVGGRRKAEGE